MGSDCLSDPQKNSSITSGISCCHLLMCNDSFGWRSHPVESYALKMFLSLSTNIWTALGFLVLISITFGILPLSSLIPNIFSKEFLSLRHLILGNKDQTINQTLS